MFVGFSNGGREKGKCKETGGKSSPSLPILGPLKLQRRWNLDGLFTAAAVLATVEAIVAAVLSPLSLVKLLEGEYLGGFKILDTDSFRDAHR